MNLHDDYQSHMLLKNSDRLRILRVKSAIDGDGRDGDPRAKSIRRDGALFVPETGKLLDKNQNLQNKAHTGRPFVLKMPATTIAVLCLNLMESVNS